MEVLIANQSQEYTNSMEQSPFWDANSDSASQENTPFMEPEGSLPQSQKPETGPYPELDESRPQNYTIFP
jgi:hypothetical protein